MVGVLTTRRSGGSGQVTPKREQRSAIVHSPAKFIWTCVRAPLLVVVMTAVVVVASIVMSTCGMMMPRAESCSLLARSVRRYSALDELIFTVTNDGSMVMLARRSQVAAVAAAVGGSCMYVGNTTKTIIIRNSGLLCAPSRYDDRSIRT
jgi:hypothetical protein